MRLLTAQASVGIVLGKRGATVSQLRQETGASIKVLPAEPVPAVYGGSAGGDEDAGGCRGVGSRGRLDGQLGGWAGCLRARLACRARQASACAPGCRPLRRPRAAPARPAADLGSISSAGGVSSGFSGMSLGGSAGTTITTGGGSSGGGAEEVIQVEGTVQQCVAALRGVATLLRGWQIRRLMAAMQQQQQSFGAMQLQHAALAAAAAGGLPVSPTGVASLSGPMSPPSPGALAGAVWRCGGGVHALRTSRAAGAGLRAARLARAGRQCAWRRPAAHVALLLTRCCPPAATPPVAPPLAPQACCCPLR